MTHYETLGISSSATPEEIKKAYRTLSLKLHPDRTSDPSLVERYKAVNVAYEILSDVTEKQKYDFELNHMSDLSGFMPPGFPPPGFMPQMFGGPGIKIFTPHHGRGEHIFSGPMGETIDMEEIFNMLHAGIGMSNRMNKPIPIITNLSIDISMILTGASVPVRIERWTMETSGIKTVETETIYVDIPKGIDDNEIIIIREKGNVLSDSNKGDIKVIVNIKNDTKFTRKGLDLVYPQTISLKDALCGFSFDIRHLNGKTYTINNTGGKIIKDNHTTTIPSLGLTRNEYTGQLHIIFTVEFPTSLTPQQIEGIKGIL
jgi:DnaJ family protein A protein 2